jgi:hypothetical protein
MLSDMHDFSGKLSPLQPTLDSVLKQAGYQTVAVIASAVLDSRFGLNPDFCSWTSGSGRDAHRA